MTHIDDAELQEDFESEEIKLPDAFRPAGDYENDDRDEEHPDVEILNFYNFAVEHLGNLAHSLRYSRMEQLDLVLDDVEIKMRKKPAVLVWPAPAQKASPTGKEVEKNIQPVTSKFLGILNLKDKNGSYYVKKGDFVKKGQTLAVVKTINIPNDVKAEFSGRIIEVAESDGRPVEFGQPLFFIELD